MVAVDKNESGLGPTRSDRALSLAFGVVTIVALISGGIVRYGDFGRPLPLPLACTLIVVGTALAFATLLTATKKLLAYRRSAEAMAVLFSIAVVTLADNLPKGLLLLNLAVVVAYVLMDTDKLLKRRPALALYVTLALVVFDDILFIWSLVA